MKTAIVHIGLPKTGTTSLQFLLGENRLKLKRQGADFFLGSLAANRYNHGELYLSVLRDGVTTFGTQKHSFDKANLWEQTRARIHNFITRSRARTLLFSSEGLSFLRTPTELSQLRELFPNDVDFKIFIVERQADEWLESWRRQIVSNPKRTLSSDPRSALYVEKDTWLIDFEGLKDVYDREFGEITTFQYRKKGLLQEILETAGLRLDLSPDTYQYKSGAPSRSRPSSKIHRAIARVNRSLNQFDYWWNYER